ncbi:MAG: hypothetical protein SRB2_02853 [Desulfobacteraceae bacterium Eth-SRB2]|nr:MAG: hypothetical protein SRB2_02853 [Desulfobacteraceae bacterium Eth-SRB2]
MEANQLPENTLSFEDVAYIGINPIKSIVECTDTDMIKKWSLQNSWSPAIRYASGICKM